MIVTFDRNLVAGYVAPPCSSSRPSTSPRFGGLRQQRVRGAIGGHEFASSVMPAGGGRLALSVSMAMMLAAGTAVGDLVDIVINRVGRE